MSESLERRHFVFGGLAGLAALAVGGCKRRLEGATDTVGSTRAAPPRAPLGAGSATLPKPRALASRLGALGDLLAPDANGIRLPAGFESRVLATSGQRVLPTKSMTWHQAPDGGACFAQPDGGWIYVSNAELPLVGGAGALRFDGSGTLIDAYPILSGTTANCAGGATPWGTWLSCEEYDRGQVHECDPLGLARAEVRPALGVFKHEGVAVDPRTQQLYLSEDQPDGLLYRFTSARRLEDGRPDLTDGKLEALRVGVDGKLSWLPVPDPGFTRGTPTRQQVPDAFRFRGGEGVVYGDGKIYLATKHDDRVWVVDLVNEKLSLLYDAHQSKTPFLSGVDNLLFAPGGEVLVAEDGGDMELVVIQRDGSLRRLLQIPGHASSEIAGPAFDPNGTRLYLSSQRGLGDAGITYEIAGPFHASA